jgi:activator of HSP90 ATPase
LRKFCEQSLHFDRGGTRKNPRRVLEIHQDNFDAVLLQQGNAAPNELLIRRKVVTPKHRISSYLPDDQIGVFGKNVAVETRQLLRNILAADAVIDYPDLDAGKSLA